MMTTIAIVSVVDVVGALASETLAGSIYLVDNNKTNGSFDEGSEALKTKVRKGDQLVWVCVPVECEAFVSITGVEIDEKFRAYCNPKRELYQNTNISYWLGNVVKEVDVIIPYKLKFKIGSQEAEMVTTTSPLLFGDEIEAVATDME